MSDLPFNVTITPGKPAYEQVINAVHKAIATGRLRVGDAFPSVRSLSKEVRINPNTAHKVVQHLVQEGTLEVIPGRGTRIAAQAVRSLQTRLSELDVEALVIEAIRLGFNQQELVDAIEQTWNKLTKKRKN